MKRLPIIFSALCLVSIVSTLAQPSQRFRPAPETEKRIQRIENGLLLPVVIKGQPSESMKLADRMLFYKTPGVSIAFIKIGRAHV